MYLSKSVTEKFAPDSIGLESPGLYLFRKKPESGKPRLGLPAIANGTEPGLRAKTSLGSTSKKFEYATHGLHSPAETEQLNL